MGAPADYTFIESGVTHGCAGGDTVANARPSSDHVEHKYKTPPR